MPAHHMLIRRVFIGVCLLIGLLIWWMFRSALLGLALALSMLLPLLGYGIAWRVSRRNAARQPLLQSWHVRDPIAGEEQIMHTYAVEEALVRFAKRADAATSARRAPQGARVVLLGQCGTDQVLQPVLVSVQLLHYYDAVCQEVA